LTYYLLLWQGFLIFGCWHLVKKA